MIVVRDLRKDQLERLLKVEKRLPFTYAAVGGTRSELPSGYRHDTRHVVIGNGRDRFDRLVELVKSWNLQRAAGIGVFPEAVTVEEGQTMLLTLKIGPLFAICGARVVYVIDEPNRYGFAYGTTPLHPECGEEYFGVTLGTDDTVTFDLAGFSRPRAWLVKIGAPVARILQVRAINAYATAAKGA